MELYTKAIEETWIRSAPNGAFEAYNENLKILLDLLEKIELSSMPPALLESLAFHLNRVGYYVGTQKGESRSAYSTWMSRKVNIPFTTIQELGLIAKSRRYNNLTHLLTK